MCTTLRARCGKHHLGRDMQCRRLVRRTTWLQCDVYGSRRRKKLYVGGGKRFFGGLEGQGFCGLAFRKGFGRTVLFEPQLVLEQ